MITPKSLKRLKLEKMVEGTDNCAEEIQYFDWNWHILSRAKKSYEICRSIDYTSSTFPRRTQWWLWQLKSCFSPACWILHISGALIYYLFNGRILSEASFISQMEGSIKKRQILVVLFRLGERLAKISSKPCSKVWGMGQARPGEKMQNSWRVFWRVAVYKITNMIIDLLAVLFASNKLLNSGALCWIYYFNINNAENHRCLTHFKCTFVSDGNSEVKKIEIN